MVRMVRLSSVSVIPCRLDSSGAHRTAFSAIAPRTAASWRRSQADSRTGRRRRWSAVGGSLTITLFCGEDCTEGVHSIPRCAAKRVGGDPDRYANNRCHERSTSGPGQKKDRPRRDGPCVRSRWMSQPLWADFATLWSSQGSLYGVPKAVCQFSPSCTHGCESIRSHPLEQV